MGTIQNSINQTLGTLAGAATMGKHISNQNKELNVKKIEAEQEQFNANEALLKNEAKYLNEQELEKGLANVTDADSYLSGKSDEAEAAYDKASTEKMKRDFAYEMGIQKNKPSSKRLEKAMQAYENVQDEITARQNLKFNLEIARKKYEVLGGKD